MQVPLVSLSLSVLCVCMCVCVCVLLCIHTVLMLVELAETKHDTLNTLLLFCEIQWRHYVLYGKTGGTYAAIDITP